MLLQYTHGFCVSCLSHVFLVLYVKLDDTCLINTHPKTQYPFSQWKYLNN